MIVCTVNKNNNSYTVEIKGHSGYEAIGKDIVCSSVSTAFILTVNLLTVNFFDMLYVKFFYGYRFLVNERSILKFIVVHQPNKPKFNAIRF